MKTKIIIRGVLFLLVISSMIQLISSTTISDENSVNFVLKGVIKCSQDGTRWIDGTQTPPTEIPTMPQSNPDVYYNCKAPLGSLDPEITCCPDSYSCVNSNLPTSGGQERKICNMTTNTQCQDFKTQSSCEGNAAIAKTFYQTIYFKGNPYCPNPDNCLYCQYGTQIGPSWNCIKGVQSGQCWNTSSCDCIWTNNSICVPKINYTILFRGTDIQRESAGSCANPYNSVTDNCATEGYYVFNIDAIWTPGTNGAGPSPGECEPRISQVPCGDVVGLGFFNMFNILSVIVILIITYYFYFREQRGS